MIDLKRIILVSMALLRTFVMAIKELVWSIAGVILVNMLLLNYLTNEYPITISKTFLEITQVLSQHIVLFFVIFWIYFSYFEVKDVLKCTDKRGEELGK